MTDSERKVYRNKKDFVEDMDITLGAYPEFGLKIGLKSIEYKKDEFDEYLRIAYRDGRVSWICVTGDSTGAILGAIANSVRGRCTYGTVLSAKRKDKLERETDWEEI